MNNIDQWKAEAQKDPIPPCTMCGDHTLKEADQRILALCELVEKKDLLMDEALTYKHRPSEVTALLIEALALTDSLGETKE